jgi:magnesium-transporting ATPase (P-type)
VKLSLGGVVAADVHLTGGSVELDQSMLTGESLPIDAGAGTDTFAGALVRRGEATAIVTATGTRTKFGRTAELVRSAHVVSTQQKAVLRIIRNLAVFNCLIIVAMGAYAYHHAMPSSEMIPLLLTSVLAIIPVALPATFTLAAAIGARALAKQGVLPTRLSAVDEAASIDVLCSDKTGTLTRNELTVTSVRPLPGFDEAHVLGMAALASSEGGQDPVDAAIRLAASQKTATNLPKLTVFVPFDPVKKTSEATATDPEGSSERIIKGAFTAVVALTAPSPCRGRYRRRTREARLSSFGSCRGSASIQPDHWIDCPQRSAADRLDLSYLGVEWSRRAHSHGDRRCSGHSRNRRSRGWIAGSSLPARQTTGRHSNRKTSRSLQAFFRKANLTSLRRSRRADIQLGCVAMAPMMRLRCARHR